MKRNNSHQINYAELIGRLEKTLRGGPPGQEAQYKMAPIGRSILDLDILDQSQVRKAAVLALFYEHQNLPYLVLTLRTQYEGVHSGQISFPGGKREESDRNFEQTALRETHEEIGIAESDIALIGELSPLYIPPSNFLVRPFVGKCEQKPDFKKQHSEVAQIIRVDFNKLLDEQSLTEQIVMARGFKQRVPAFKIDNLVIWGATAMMCSELREAVL